VSLDESLALVALAAVKEPHRHSRYAVRWLRRLLEEDDGLTLEEAALAVSALAALGGPSTDQAHATKRGKRIPRGSFSPTISLPGAGLSRIELKTARCHRCERDLAVAAFATDRSKASGRKSICRECDREKARLYDAKHWQEPAG
jgi:hypothetical protein